MDDHLLHPQAPSVDWSPLSDAAALESLDAAIAGYEPEPSTETREIPREVGRE